MLYNFFHKACNDGTASAWVVKRKFSNVFSIPTEYSKLEWRNTNIQKEDFIYFTDISPDPEDAIKYIIEVGADFIVYDHHKTALEKLEKFLNNNKDVYNIKEKYVFDLNVCGTIITWNNLFSEEKIPEILEYVNFGDMWEFDKKPNSKEIIKYMRHNLKFNDIDSFDNIFKNFNLEEGVKIGKILLEQAERQIDRILYNKCLIDFDGTLVLATNDSLYTSEGGHELANKSPSGLGMVYYLVPGENNVMVSVRGNGAKEFCERYGGGGHQNAAGANMSIDKFFNYLKTAKSYNK